MVCQKGPSRGKAPPLPGQEVVKHRPRVFLAWHATTHPVSSKTKHIAPNSTNEETGHDCPLVSGDRETRNLDPLFIDNGPVEGETQRVALLDDDLPVGPQAGPTLAEVLRSEAAGARSGLDSDRQ